MKGQFDQALAEAFYFEESDVVANRAGRMSKRQQEGFAAGAEQNRKHGPVLLKVIAVAAIVVVAFSYFANSKGKGDTDIKQVIIPLAIAVVLMLLIGVIANRRTKRLAGRMAQGAPVQVAEGKVVIDEHPSDWSDRSHPQGWEVAIGEVKFRLLQDQAEAFVDGERYRIYYCDFKMARLTFLTAERAV
jgi:hypothetical protein